MIRNHVFIIIISLTCWGWSQVKAGPMNCGQIEDDGILQPVIMISRNKVNTTAQTGVELKAATANVQTEPAGQQGMIAAAITVFVVQAILLILLIISVIKKHRVEQKLAASNRMLRTILDTIPVRVFWKDQNSCYLGSNRLFAQDAGVDSVDDLNGKNDFELAWTKEQAEFFREVDAKVIREKQVILDIEEPVTTVDGDVITIQTSKVPLCNDMGDVIGVLGVYNDITDRIKAREQTNRLIEIMEMTTDLVATADRNMTLVFLNGSGREMLGRGLDGEALSDIVVEHLHPTWAYRKIMDVGIPEAQKNGVWNGETALLNNDGKVIPVSQVIMTHKNKGGQIEFMSTIMRDITHIKNTQRIMKEREKSLEMTLNAIGDAVIVIDVDKKIKRMNSTAESIVGKAIAELKNVAIDDLLNFYDHERKALFAPVFESVIQHGDILSLPMNTVLSLKNGGERIITGSVAPVRDFDGKIVGMVLVFRDVTQKYQIEEQLMQSQKMDSIGKLAGGIAHDFNNMLVGMLGYANLLKSKTNDEKQLDYVEKILSTASRASELTSKLMTFSRKGKMQKRVVDCHLFIQEALALLERSIDKRIIIKRELQAENKMIKGDPVQLQNAILNLGLNARDAMPEKGNIIVTTKNVKLDEHYCRTRAINLQPGEFIQISVADSGHGINRDVCEHIFEPFFTTKKRGKGTGLGLSVVYGTIVEHGGAINVYSELDQGTEFHIYLPLATEVVENREAAVQPSIRKGSGTILVVDDETVVRSLAGDLLEELGYRVLLAADGEKGLTTFKSYQDKIDLVILDIVMPVMNGVECFHELRKIKPDLKVLLNSGFAKDSKIDDLLKQDGVGFIRKPYTSEDVSQAVEELLLAVH